MTINQKYHKVDLLKVLEDSLNGYKEAAEENIEYEKERLKEEGEEDNSYRKKNIENYKDRLIAIEYLKKEFDKLA